MGWVVMSERELLRVEVLSKVVAGRVTVTAAAGLLGVSRRQAHRLLAAFRRDGASVLRHKGRGRQSNRAFNEAMRAEALAHVRERYADFGPTLAAEMLAARHGLVVSRETLRGWMLESGLWRSRRQRRTLHQPRLRREHLGELVQIDGSEHRWFEDRAGPCTLLVFIDDATGRLMQLRFVKSESAFSYFEALGGYLEQHGRPVAFYSDKHSVFRVSKTEAKGGSGMTQFGRALAELGIEILCANSSQAKGRVERVNRTLQDRLVKELRLEGVASIEAGNAFVAAFVERFNGRFATPALRQQNLHRPLDLSPDRLADVLAWREKRHVGRELALSYQRRRIILDDGEIARHTVGQYVDTYAFPDGRFEVRWKGVTLPYRSFDKDQRVTHAAIVENKWLSETLAWIKERQDELRPPEVKSSSDKGGYVRTGEKAFGQTRQGNETSKARKMGRQRAARAEATAMGEVSAPSPRAPAQLVPEPV